MAAGGMWRNINLQLENNLPIGDVAFSAQAISGFLLPSRGGLHTVSLVSEQYSLLNKSFHVAVGNFVTMLWSYFQSCSVLLIATV